MPAIDTTTTTTTSTSSQQGIKLVVSSQANTQQVGTYVTDVSIAPYINPTIISFYAYNMRPNQLIHVFFDSVLVDQYCAPAILPTTPFFLDSSNYQSILINGTWGAPIYTDSTGVCAGQFAVPGGTFKTGDRVLELADVTSLAQGSSSITTVASATFTASNLNVTKQAITLTTVNPQISTIGVSNTVSNTQVSTSTTVLPDLINVVNNVITNTQVITIANVVFVPYIDPPYLPSEPIAQALTINTPQNQAGVFATSLDLFFQQTSHVSNNGCSVYLCEMNNGYPNTNCILPFSQVHLNQSNIAVSATANVSTNFKFQAPVFLNNGVQYAFVVQPDNNDPDYRLYTANVGDIDITTGVQVFSQPISGTAYYGATNKTWTALQTEYVKFNLRRATFMSAQGDAYFNNSNTDYIFITGLSLSNSTATITPGDYIYQATSSNPTTANASVTGVFKFYDTVRNIVYIDNSTGNFSNGSTILQFHRFTNTSVMTPNTTTIIGFANTTQFYNPVVDAYVPQMAQIVPAGTSLTYAYKGTSNSYVADTAENSVVAGTHNEFYDEERIVSSLSNEVSHMSSAKSFTLHASLSTTSSYVSPLIDTVRNQQLVIANLIDPVAFNYNEFYNFSNTKSKYVTKIITLAQGQDAEDIQISLTAHRPPGTGIQVWIKFLNAEDADPISLKTWSPLVNQGASIYSDPSNPNDFKEYNFITPTVYTPIAVSGTITCTNASANVTGVGTSFGTQIQVGYWINVPTPNTTFADTARQVISITNTTLITLNSPFLGNYTAVAPYIAPPPTAAYRSQNTFVNTAGTVATSNVTNIITGTGTSFNTQFFPGNIINIANNEEVVVSVTNSTSLTVGTAWNATVSGVPAYLVSPNGVTYLNSNNALYSTFKQFQIKIVLQSNDSSKVPFLDDLRCLALQT
ncbi:MAG: hypothetical protein ACXV2C_00285 [Candidatus Bathyarchaeia archaeon]